MRRPIRKAYPAFDHIETSCNPDDLLDMLVEKMGLHRLPPKYEKILERFFKTDDKNKILYDAQRQRFIPILVPDCGTIELLDTKKRKTVKKLGRRMRGRVRDVLHTIDKSRVPLDEKDDMSSRVREFDRTHNPSSDLTQQQQRALYPLDKDRVPLTKKKPLEIIEGPHAVYRRELRNIDERMMEKQIADRLVCRLNPNAPGCSPRKKHKGRPKLQDTQRIKGPEGTAVVDFDLKSNPAEAFLVTQWK